jgi:hypothetical protein
MANQDHRRHLLRQLLQDAEKRACRAGVHAIVVSDRRRDRELGGRESPGLTRAFRWGDDS